MTFCSTHSQSVSALLPRPVLVPELISAVADVYLVSCGHFSCSRSSTSLERLVCPGSCIMTCRSSVSLYQRKDWGSAFQSWSPLTQQRNILDLVPDWLLYTERTNFTHSPAQPAALSAIKYRCGERTDSETYPALEGYIVDASPGRVSVSERDALGRSPAPGPCQRAARQ